MRHTLLSLLFSLVFCGTAQADWRATWASDEFTDVNVCRVEPHGPLLRSALRGLMGSGITYHFFVEVRGDVVLAGVRSEPAYPIPGDVQIRVGNAPAMTLGVDHAVIYASETSQPAPYIRPEASAEEREAIEAAVATAHRTAAAMQSPARALQGDAALDLLRQIQLSDRVIYRIVTGTGNESRTAEFTPDASLWRAIEACGIDLSERN